ncbi:MAG: hypothetical protein AAGA48_04045 [Myxococcota bacterium]
MILEARGLDLRPPQVWGTIRLVPIVRDVPLVDLRLAVRPYEGAIAVTEVSKRHRYISYVPHGIVMRWNERGEAAVPVETRIGARELRQEGPVVWLKRMVRREARDQLRLLPLHTAMEGFLALHFGGPQVAHRYYSKRVLSDGFDPRVEGSVRGEALPGLDEALRTFEVHDGQCGMLIFVGDHLASAMLVAHPDDYLALHEALLQDCYGTIVARFGWGARRQPLPGVTLEGTSFEAIGTSLQRARDTWAWYAREMSTGLLGRSIQATTLRQVGNYSLVRFSTGFDVERVTQDGEHLGEALVAADGTLAYLKTYRLDRGQSRRGRMLSRLAEHDWDIRALANADGHGKIGRVVGDLVAAGLDWVVRDEIRRQGGSEGV